MVYIMYERLKGEGSFYHPYFDMVDSPLPTCFWPEELLERSDLHEFRLCLRDAKANCEEEWLKIESFLAANPEHFDPDKATKELYLWALGFVQSRAFGWGLPCTMLAPMADCLNHNNATYINPDLLEPNLHKAGTKSYLYKHNFDKEMKKHYSEDDLYDKSTSRLRYNCKKLFAEDDEEYQVP